MKVTVPKKLSKAEKEALEGYQKVSRENPRERFAEVSVTCPSAARYMISVAAELVGMHPQTLRLYEAKGLVRPARTPGGTRLYSDADLERLRLIQRLTTELGLNLAGVEHVLRLEDELRQAAGADGPPRARAARRDRRRAQDATSASSSSTGPRPSTRPRGADMDFNKLTLKSQEAVAAAQELARRAGNPELTPDHLTVALLEQELPRTLVDRAGYAAAELRAEAEARLAQPADRLGRGGGAAASLGALSRVLDKAFDEMRGARRRVRLGRAPAARARRRPARRAARRRSRASAAGRR